MHERHKISALVRSMNKDGWRIEVLIVNGEWYPVTTGLELRETLICLEAFDRGIVVFRNQSGERSQITISLKRAPGEELFSDPSDDEALLVAIERAHTE